MKKKFLLLTFLVIAFFCWKCQSAHNKPPYALIINEANISRYPSPSRDSSTQFFMDLIVANNTDDTLKYTQPWAKDAMFYSTDNANLQVINNEFIQSPAAICDTIPPHECRGLIIIHLRFKKLPDTTFKFKIGMRLLKWQERYKVVDPDFKTIQQADILWSDEEIFKTNKNHKNYDKTPEEYKKQCEKVLDTLSDNDRRNYILNIEPDRIGMLKDTTDYYFDSVVYRKDTTGYMPRKKQFKFVLVPLKLINNSDKQLEYTSWLCSWHEMYQTNNKNVSIIKQFCSGNYPVTMTISPHSSSIYNMPVLFDKNKSENRNYYKFRIGMTLLKANLVSFHGFYWALPVFKRDSKYLIWSNEITIPITNALPGNSSQKNSARLKTESRSLQ